MACSACAKRAQRGRIVPVNPAPRPAADPNGAQAQGARLRDVLRYTGRR